MYLTKYQHTSHLQSQRLRTQQRLGLCIKPRKPDVLFHRISSIAKQDNPQASDVA